jgi:hypothetical protein
MLRQIGAAFFLPETLFKIRLNALKPLVIKVKIPKQLELL